MKIYFVNTTPILVKCLEQAIAEVLPYLPESIELSVMQLLLHTFLKNKKQENTVLVTPANSFSFMGGGFDMAVLSTMIEGHQYEREVEKAVQEHCLLANHGFLPPASAHTVKLSELPHTAGSIAAKSGVLALVQVPTMEVPGPILFDRVFYSTWAALSSFSDVEAAVMPAFGAGFGGVPPGTCARLMVGAIALWYMPAPSPLARSAGVLLYLRRKYTKLGKPSDISEIEAFYTEHGKSSFTQTGKESQHWPLPWHRMVKGLTWVHKQRE